MILAFLLPSSHEGILLACCKELALHCWQHPAAADTHLLHQQDTAVPQSNSKNCAYYMWMKILGQQSNNVHTSGVP